MDAVNKLARIAFTFVMLNYAAAKGLFVLRRGREVWK